MLELGQKELEEIQRLVLDPTPANFQAITANLESLSANVSKAVMNPDLLRRDAIRARAFFQKLPSELARVRTLMGAPVAFYRNIEAIRTAHFGAYERSGELRSLEAKPPARTVVHL